LFFVFNPDNKEKEEQKNLFKIIVNY